MEPKSIFSNLRRIFELQDPQHARLLPMEGLRGSAVTLVFLQHYSVQTQLIGLPTGPSSAFAGVFRTYGNLGVELFFVLSGFLIYGTLVKKAPPFTSFMARRYQRIYPAFLAIFAIALAITILVPIPGKIPEGAAAATAYLLANLALLPGLFPIVGIVDVAWSLSYEMFFYFATAALVLGFRLHRMTPNHRIALILALGAAFLLASAADIPHFPDRMLPFFAGMLLAEGVGERVPAWAGWSFPLAAFLATAFHVMPGRLAEPIHTLAFFALCAVCFRDRGLVSRVMIWTPIRWLGNMSYSYYLAHGFAVRIAMVILARFLPHGLSELMFWSLLPIFYAATLLASSLLFVWVEKPQSLRPAPVSAIPSPLYQGREG